MQGFTKPGTSGFEPRTQGANVGTVAAQQNTLFVTRCNTICDASFTSNHACQTGVYTAFRNLHGLIIVNGFGFQKCHTIQPANLPAVIPCIDCGYTDTLRNMLPWRSNPINTTNYISKQLHPNLRSIMVLFLS